MLLFPKLCYSTPDWATVLQIGYSTPDWATVLQIGSDERLVNCGCGSTIKVVPLCFPHQCEFSTSSHS